MKLQVTQENLSRALGVVAKVANTRGTLPVLANVLLKIVDNRLSIIATNLDIAITHFIGAKVVKEGAITIPARLTQDFVTSLPGGVIDLEVEDNKIHITSGKYSSTINGISAEDFPVMPAITGTQSWKIPQKVLKSGLQQVVFAASTDEARPVLTGVYLHTHNGALFAVATDSYRLAEKQLVTTKQEVSMLIPATATQDLLRIMGDDEGEVSVIHDDQQVLFTCGNTELVTRLIEGSYPDYRKLIPHSFTTSATLEKTELTNITKVSSLFARENAGSVTINVEEKPPQVTIHSVASQLGENTSSAEAKVQGGGSITLNSRYLLDALGALQGSSTSLSFNGKLEPSVLTDVGSKDYVHVIMPLKS